MEAPEPIAWRQYLRSARAVPLNALPPLNTTTWAEEEAVDGEDGEETLGDAGGDNEVSIITAGNRLVSPCLRESEGSGLRPSAHFHILYLLSKIQRKNSTTLITDSFIRLSLEGKMGTAQTDAGTDAGRCLLTLVWQGEINR